MTEHEDYSGVAPFGWRDGEHSFAMVPRWLIVDRRVTATAVRLYAFIASEAWRSDGVIEKPRKWIQAQLKLSRSTVYRAEQKLEELGAAKIEAGYDSAGDYGPMRYELRFTDPAGSSKMTKGDVKNDTGSGQKRDGVVSELTDIPSLIEREEEADGGGSKNEQSRSRADLISTLARHWADLRGFTKTRKLLATLAADIREYIEDSGDEPTTDDLDRWHAQGIRRVGGWAYVAGDNEQAATERDWSFVDGEE